MSGHNIPRVPYELPLPPSPSLAAVVEAACRDAFESGYVACRRHLIVAALNAPDINYVRGVGKHRLAELKLQAVLATNMTLNATPRRPNQDLGRSVLFEATLRAAAKLAADLGVECVLPSHLLAALKEHPAMDEDMIDPSYWDWNGVTFEHSDGFD